jgi:imidazolonepropionase-like amidohydrolase/Tol biopolymer transport system component
MLKALAALPLLLAGTSAWAQAAQPAPTKWDVANPPVPTREVRIDVSEGTWMNLDLSPDGRTIVFDLLGDIYTMPIAGGAARRIAEGLPYEMQPRFSPDGRLIAFTSDRGGGDNIWVMNADGSDKRAVTKESFETLNNPSWSADGRYIAARKHFTTTRSLGTGEVWLYHLGGGAGVPLVQRPSPQHQKELGEPTFTPTGDAIYFTRNTTPGAVFEYAEDSNRAIYAIERYDMATGERSTVAAGAGGAVRPAPSPDGKWLAFVRRERAKSRLYVKDLRSGEERKIYDDLDQDMQEIWAVQGLYPNMDWTPDSRSILFWAGGKLRRIDSDGSNAREIPFRISDTRRLIDPPRTSMEVAPDSFTTRIPRFAAVSPDGRQVVFESLGRLYLKDMAGGAARPLITSKDGDFQLWPSWSRDGSRIAFVSWNDRRLGEIRTVAANGSGPRTVTRTPGHYRRPRFSPDGKTIVFERGNNGGLTSDLWTADRGVYRVDAAGGEAVRLTASGSNAHYGAASDRVFMEVSEDTKRRLVSVDLNGKDQRTHAEGSLVSGYQVSPTGEHLAFRENYNVFVMPFLPGAQTLTAGSKGNQLPIVRASGDGGAWFQWGQNGRSIAWTLGPNLYSAETATLIRNLPVGQSEKAESFTPPTSGVSLAMRVPAEKPPGVTVITGARIVTMAAADGGVIENGVIVIDGNRIRSIGPAGAIPAIPAGARVIDAAGKTIIPGIIDAHAHGPQGVDELVPQQNWSALAHLAFGVTTVHDPSSQAAHIFAAAEMQRAGLLLGPRTFSTGETIYGARSFGFAQIEKYEDALAHVRRLKAQGAHSIKNYIMPRREQRQQIIAAALQEKIPVVAEGGAQFGLGMAHIADGNTTVEHNLPQARLYEDVLSYFSQSKVGYTPTLVVTFGGLGGDPYWRQATEVWRHPLLTRHVPPEVLAQSVRSTKAPEEDFADKVSAASAHALSKRGVPVSIGGHGQEVGLASHWEMWSFVRGGMSPLEALRAATVTPAQVYGFSDIGTLEPGKLADLVILDADPLADIRNSDKVSKVMLNGRLYDAATLNEEVTGSRKRQPYPWE